MDLILWRHAEAVDLDLVGDDFERYLTHKGEKHAARMAVWLERQLPDRARVYSSPAVRAEQTAQRLDRKFKTTGKLAPLSTPDDLLELVQWPHAKGCTLVVGHQPMLGQTISRLMGLAESECAMKKGSVWWLRYREDHPRNKTVLVTVQSPDFL